jgi:hypothetical protein
MSLAHGHQEQPCDPGLFVAASVFVAVDRKERRMPRLIAVVTMVVIRQVLPIRSGRFDPFTRILRVEGDVVLPGVTTPATWAM